MIITEFYMERDDGVRLVRTYSDKGVMIRQTVTGEEYDAAIYPESIAQQWEETNKSADELGDELTDEEALTILLGGD